MATNSKSKAAAKKAPAKKAPAKKAAAKAEPAKKAPAKKAAAKEAPAKKAPAVKKAAAAKAEPAKKAPAKKAPAKAEPVKKAPAKNAAAKKADPAQAAPAKKAPAAKSVSATKTAVPSKTEKPVEQLKFGSPGYPFDQAFLDAQVKLLHEERETLVGQAMTLRSEADALARDREPGDVQFDDESGEGDTLAVERDMDLARAASALQTVDEIDAALERITKGVYGICEYSGLAIPKERLKAIPYARERVEYKTRSFR